ncbi:MAG: phosphoserine phosphatase RsbU/P [Acidobacteriota bacterium]|jgi:sigma-B regulation protein RsbU (phosphoserine phosphatase)|nr:phosphoserine phosphatase RsbU/P [Acidobacteriota bacterium]
MMQLRTIPVSFLIRRSVRYMLVSHGFRLLQAVVVLAALSFLLTGSRIAFIDRYGNRADIVASIFVTVATIALLTTLNRRVMASIDRRFFREAYDAELILTELGEAIPTLSKTRQLVELVANKITDALHPENVTVFLDDEERGAYVAAFLSDASRAGAALPTRLRGLLLHYDEWPINQLRESILNLPDSSEAGLRSQRPGLKVYSVPSDHDNQTLRAAQSTLLMPIAANGRLRGLISLGRRLSDLPYAKEDNRLLLVVANQMGTFIENMELLSRLVEEERTARERERAAEVQRHLFPADGLEDDDLEIYGTCLPALGVGGDYYDYFDTDDRRTCIAIADVAGKGYPAALLMSTVQASLRCQLISGDKSLADVVSSMNRLLQRSTGDGSYATFFLAQFDKATHSLTYVNAGHNPPMLVRAVPASPRDAGELLHVPGIPRSLSNRAVGTSAGLAMSAAEEPVVRLLTTGGPIIGTFLNGPYEQETIQLQGGDILVVYTDGVTEALNPAGVEFDEEKLRSIVVESLRLPARELAARVIAKVLEWQGRASQHDDITLIIVKVK